jgi:hypothetical protein
MKDFMKGYRIAMNSIQVKVKALDEFGNTIISHKTLNYKNQENITGLLRGEILNIFKDENYREIIAIHFNFIPEEMFGDKL